MALQLGAVRDAFLAANVPADKADKAAEELAEFKDRFAGADVKLVELTSSVRLVQAMLSVNLALTAGVLWRLLGH
ncbi:hypothetical protein [Rhodopila sp.]|uniref:hypothetical protein n=1 Tax=Rhodopila sp. TaxID=2480087 RepID=UPI003D0A5BB6